MKRSLQLTALLALAVAACMVPTDEHADVEADTEPLTTCWNTTRVTETPGWPPFDMIVSAAAMQSWQGGSWQPCTNNASDTKVVCKRFIGTPQAVAYWNYCLPSGTAADNSADMTRRDRQARGARCPHAKLTAELVLAARCSEERTEDLAKRFCVDPATLSKARRGLTWRHL